MESFLKNTPLIKQIRSEEEFEDQRPLINRTDIKLIGSDKYHVQIYPYP